MSLPLQTAQPGSVEAYLQPREDEERLPQDDGVEKHMGHPVDADCHLSQPKQGEGSKHDADEQAEKPASRGDPVERNHGDFSD